MRIIDWDNTRYFEAKKDLCELHHVSEDEEQIEIELKQIQCAFATAYPQPKQSRDYEFPDWHHNLRLFWAYLYSDRFYDAAFIPGVQKMLSSLDRSWFAEFECYSPSLQAPELPSGYVGRFLIFKDTVMFCEGEQWAMFRPKLVS